MFLFNIILKSGELSSQNPSSFVNDFVIAIVGASIGAGSALVVYFFESRRDNRKEEASRLKNGENALTYFTSLLEKIMDQANVQIGYYKEYSNNIQVKWFKNNQLKSQMDTDLERIVSFDHERLFHAYLNKLGDDKKNIIRFQNIFTAIDLLKTTFSSGEKIYSDFASEHNERLINCMDFISDFEDYCELKLNEIKSRHGWGSDAFSKKFNDTFIEYRKNRDANPGHEYMISGFITPLKISLSEFSNKNSLAFEICQKCKKGGELFGYILGHSVNKSEDFIFHANKVKYALDILEESTKDLLQRS